MCMVAPSTDLESVMELKDKTIIVTGGASGIGAAMCRRFASEGPSGLVVADTNLEGARAVAADVDRAIAIHCDVSDPESITDCISATSERFGPVDLYVSNAGIYNGGGPVEAPLDAWSAQWDVNVMAHVHAIRTLLPTMLERGSGYFLITASMAGILTSPGNAVYAATKHAAVGLAEWMSITYHAQGVRTSCLAPLGVRTPMLEELGDPDDEGFASLVAEAKEPAQVADIVVDAIGAERCLITTDKQAQNWMQRKVADHERWLAGMRRSAVTLG